MQIILPMGTDVSNLIPEFTTYSSTDKVYIENKEQISGVSRVDFTQNITYTLVSSLLEDSNIKVMSTVNIKIIYQ